MKRVVSAYCLSFSLRSFKLQSFRFAQTLVAQLKIIHLVIKVLFNWGGTLIKALISKWIILSWAIKVWAKREPKIFFKRSEEKHDLTFNKCLAFTTLSKTNSVFVLLKQRTFYSKLFIFFSKPVISNRIFKKFFHEVSYSALTTKTILF